MTSQITALSLPGSVEPPTDLRRPLLAGLAVIGVALGGFATWAALAPLDSAVVASGVVSVESKRKPVQHREGGIVAQVLAHEGDVVLAGAVIARLQDAGARAQLATLSAQRDTRLAERARLAAERDGHADIDFPAELVARADDPAVADVVAREHDRFVERAKTLAGQEDILQERVAQFETQKTGRARLEQSKRRQTALLRDELVGLRQLEAKGYYPRNRLRAGERDLARLEGDLYADGAAGAGIDKEIGEARLQILQIHQKFRDDAVAELAKVEAELDDLTQKLAAAGDMVRRLDVVAPVAGTVQSLDIAGPGAVVPPNGTVAEIVPAADRLIVETQLDPRDIDRVHQGQAAHLRFSAFGARVTPVIAGAVSVVSADRFTDSATHRPYFTARVEVPDDQLARLPGPLKAGMPVEVMLDGGTRTPFEYLTKPLADSFARGLKER